MNPLSIDLELIRRTDEAATAEISEELSAMDYLQQLGCGVRVYNAIQRALYYLAYEGCDPRYAERFIALRGVKTGRQLAEVAKKGFWLPNFGKNSLAELRAAIVRDGSFK